MKKHWSEFVQEQEGRVYSQKNQDAKIKYIFDNIGTTNKQCVEFGFNSDTLTGGSGANVANLVMSDGWHPHLFDGDRENPIINLKKQFITPENVTDVFCEAGIDEHPDFVSIDVDSTDLWIMDSLLRGRFQPRVISVEYNANFSLDEFVTVKKGTTWENYDAVYGASLAALILVARCHQYTLVAVEPGLDAFFVRDEFIPYSLPINRFERYCNIPTHNAPSKERCSCFMDFLSYVQKEDDTIQESTLRRLGWL